MIDIEELPRAHGFPVGQYILRYSTINTSYHDAQFVNGVTNPPISGRTLQRLRMAYGSECVIEPADAETRQMVIDHLESIGRPARAAELRGDAPPATPPAEPTPEPLVETPPPTDEEPPSGPELEEAVETAEPIIDQEIDRIVDVPVLQSIAAGLNITVDETWKVKRLRYEIRKAREALQPKP